MSPQVLPVLSQRENFCGVCLNDRQCLRVRRDQKRQKLAMTQVSLALGDYLKIKSHVCSVAAFPVVILGVPYYN